ncbi:hypothetical protein JOD14_002426 [Enterococcus lemanii]|uniref:Uncharacterized protein n=1 Tax=Enterococcus lemanii TaxID=1159752 RepID=A0ABV9MXB5_9ENTE|nr:hypothetical protein [Enterococcus lemanii]
MCLFERLFYQRFQESNNYEICSIINENSKQPSQSQLLQKKPKNELSFLAFNQSLMIGDLKTIHAELDKIFATIVAQHYDPEEARYLAFFLFSDIARQYPNIAGEIYDEAMQKVRHSLR